MRYKETPLSLRRQREKSKLALQQLNEELVAANEELTASNEQLIATEEELKHQYEELVRSRDELAAVNQRLVGIIEFLPDATFILNQNKKVIAWNRAIEEMTGVAKEEMLGRGDFAYSIPFYGQRLPGLLDFFTNDLVETPYQKVRKSGNTITAEVFAPALYARRGAHLQLKTSLLYDSSGKITGAIESIRDISEQKQIQKSLLLSEARFRSLAENALDMIYQINLEPEPHFSYMSPAAEKITGFRPEEFYADINVHRNGVHPEDWPMVADILGGNFNEKATLRWKHRDGYLVWLEIFRVPIYDFKGKLVAIQGIARDINERKKLEQKLIYLSKHDPITGLYNRSFFEEEMEILEHSQADLSLMMIDLDGLKLINDTFGHKAGDQMLIDVSDILKKSFQGEPRLARIGGDEFAVLLPNCCSRAELEEYCLRIKHLIKQYNQAHLTAPPISLSIGYALRKNFGTTMNQLFAEADNNMYREKLHRNSSSRSSIVNAMMKALETRDFITEGHGERIQYLVEKVGKGLGLTPSHIFDLRLFAQFHDIGKVGIPDRILFKPGPLTADERKEMERHSELGYRIAQAAPELLPIADWILKHHEWWNGKGYPLGLKGEEIPLECRILAIADAYDAMSNQRPYRKALPHEVILEELHRFAGIQFDPNLVSLMVKIIEKEVNVIG